MEKIRQINHIFKRKKNLQRNLDFEWRWLCFNLLYILNKFCRLTVHKIRNYSKEGLPKDFAYVVTKTESDIASEKIN
jgi:hypothetical protein